MMELINELSKAIAEGRPLKEAEEKIAENIKEAVSIPEFYKLGLNIAKEILDKCDTIDSCSISNIISLGYKEFGTKVSILIPHIKCEKLDKLDEIEAILKSMEFIPIIREVNLIILGMKTKENEKDDDVGFEVDWESEYKEVQEKYEMMEKKILITKQLQNIKRNVNGEEEEREYTNEERDQIESIAEAKDEKVAIEVFSKNPSLIYGDFLHKCAENGWMEGIELALDICFISDDFINKKEKDFFGVTALIWAIREGHLEIVKYLVEKGANIEAKDRVGETALMFASERGHLEIVKYLVEKGANIIEKTNSGMTTLMFASGRGQLEIVEYLIEKGANIDEKDNDGRTALMWASLLGQLRVVTYLIEKGANIEEKDRHEKTAVTWAASAGKTEVFKYLIDKGASI